MLVAAVWQVASWGFGRMSSSHGVEEAIEEFFKAQSEGRCDDVLALVATGPSERASRDEFLKQCAASTSGFESTVENVHVISESDERATVGFELAYRGTALRVERADLVRTDGEWQVETGGLVQVGLTPLQVVDDYVQGYEKGACGKLPGLVDEDFWSASGETARKLVDFCSAAAKGRAGPRSIRIDLAGVRAIDGSRVSGELRSSYEADGNSGLFAETVGLVYSDLRWRIATGAGLHGPLGAGEALDLSRSVLSAADLPGYKAATGANGLLGIEAAALVSANLSNESKNEIELSLREAGFAYGVSRGLKKGTTVAAVRLYAFRNERDAAAYANAMISAYASNDEYPDVDRAPVAGVPGARGLVMKNAVADEPQRAVVVATHGLLLAQVMVENGAGQADLLTQASAVMRAQWDRM
ncbi:hypothetical protein GCM10027569_52560 [Flindersiella endophytica]